MKHIGLDPRKELYFKVLTCSFGTPLHRLLSKMMVYFSSADSTYQAEKEGLLVMQCQISNDIASEDEGFRESSD